MLGLCMKCFSDHLVNHAGWMAFWATLIPPSAQSQTDFLIRLLIGCTAVPMAFSRLIGLGLITGGIIVIPVNQDQLCLMSHLSAGTEKGRKRRINKEHKERKKEHKRKWHVRVLRWWTGAEKRWWGRCTTEGLWGGGGGEPHLTEYEWMSGCLTTTGSWLLVLSHWSQYPWIPSPRPLAPTALRVEKRGGKTRGAKESVSDKGTVCSVGKVERREVGAAAEWNRQASTPLVFSTSQSKATVCEKSILQSHSTHLSLSYKKQKTWRTSIFPKQQACQREHRERDRSEAKPKMLKSESGQLNARGDGGRGGVGG